jgi:hypothetical protein
VLEPRPSRGIGRREGQRVERTCDGLQVLAREMEIQDRVPDLHMAQQELNGPEVGATLQQMRGITARFSPRKGSQRSPIHAVREIAVI